MAAVASLSWTQALDAETDLAQDDVGADASLEEIAQRASVGIATRYRNFPSREDLVETVYLTEVLAVCDYVTELAALDPWDALVAWLKRFVTYLNTNRAMDVLPDSTTVRACRDALYETAPR